VVPLKETRRNFGINELGDLLECGALSQHPEEIILPKKVDLLLGCGRLFDQITLHTGEIFLNLVHSIKKQSE